MKYVLGVLGFIILTVIAVALLNMSIDSRSNRQAEGEVAVDLTEYIDSGMVVHNTQGEIVGNEDFRSVRIAVSPTERRIQVLKGYTEVIDREATFPNDSAAFEAFMHALAGAGFTLKREVENDDMRGACPTGNRFSYILANRGQIVTDLWSTSCSTKQGTFAGNDSLVERLFENQIPNYDEIIEDVDIH